jgi:hypothetical protein
MHALLIEELKLDTKQADAIVEAFKSFALDLGYSKDRISDLECRSRDGFSPYNHNYGGIECIAFADRNCLPNGNVGFPNADATIEKYHTYDIEAFEEEIGVKQENWSDAEQERFYEVLANSEDSDILFSLDIMHTGIERGVHSINLRFCVCVKDAPYHRKYDDLISIDVTFRTVSGLERKLAALLKRKDIACFSKNLSDTY